MVSPLEDNEGGEEIVGVQWTWFAPIIHLLDLISNLFTCVAACAGNISGSVASHANWVMDQRDFEAQVSKDIERITS